MHYYKIKLRLDGNPLNEIHKVVSAPELLILQFVHGDDAVTNVEEFKNEKINQREEKIRLKDTYNSALYKKDQSIDAIFGALGALPERIPNELIEKFNLDEEALKMYDPIEIAKNLPRPKNTNASLTQNQIDRQEHPISQNEINIADLFEEDDGK